MSRLADLEQLEPGMKILVSGNRVLVVDEDLARTFQPGDRLTVVERSHEVLLIAARESQLVDTSVARALSAFRQMGCVSDDQLRQFFVNFAEALGDERIWSEIARVNAEDVASAKARGRSTTRLVASEPMRRGMVDGLLVWADASSMRGRVIETVDHGSWRAELVGAELGVVAFVFEGRPNVVADATGVLRGGNTVVFRIGRDALQTAKAILEHATRPALRAAGLPEDAVTVVDSAAHAAGWALFSDSRLALAVARGSGPAVST